MELFNIAVALILAVSTPAQAEEQSAAVQHFHESVQPLLVSRCLTCHGGDQRGRLDLRSLDTALEGGHSGPALVPGDPGASLLLERVVDGEMPPNEPLPADEAAVLEEWISLGAYYPELPIDPFAVTTDERAGYDWWSLQPVNPIQPGALPGEALDGNLKEWDGHPIDRLVAARLIENDLAPSEPAPPRALIRRATYGLTGLPPTLDEVTEFERACEEETGSPGVVGERAYAALVDRLLASPHYGEHWGRHWLDVARFGESTGMEVNHLIDNVWGYRDYVIRSFNEDKPYDRMILEHLAADSIAPGDPDTEIAMAFLVCGPHDIVGNQDPAQAAQIRADAIDDMVRATSEAFLGLTVGCARCHDHKFDPISLEDYYRMYAAFEGVRHGSRSVATEEERKARDLLLSPIHAEREALQEKRDAITIAVMRRARDDADAIEAQWTRPPVDRRGTEEVFEPVEARFVRLVSEGGDWDPNATTQYTIDEFEVWTEGPDPRNAALAAHGGQAHGASRVADDFAEAYSADVTIDGAFGVSWLAQSPELTIELAQQEVVTRVFFSSDRPGALAPTGMESRFVGEYRIEVSQDGETWTAVANSHDRQPVNEAHRNKRMLELTMNADERERLAALDAELAEVNQRIAAVPPLPDLWVGALEQPAGPTHTFIGGDPQRPGDEVVPASLQAFAEHGNGYALEADAPERERRLAFAQWIADDANPLTPRVLANRLWHYHFGTGIAATPSDFGFMGAPPTHPELLDWLAHELITPAHGLGADNRDATNPEEANDQAWRLKRMHRMIMLSQTYRQSSEFREEAARIDADSRLLWRYPPGRLTAESIRDTKLALAGKLDTRMGGPGFRLYRYIRDNVSTYVPLDEHGPETYRRAVYHQNARAARIDLLTEFDSPDCALAAPRRASTTTPLQALTMMNHTFTIDMASALAERLRAEAGAEDPLAQVRHAFELAFYRAPNNTEAEAAVALIEAHGLTAFCRALLNANELIYVH